MDLLVRCFAYGADSSPQWLSPSLRRVQILLMLAETFGWGVLFRAILRPVPLGNSRCYPFLRTGALHPVFLRLTIDDIFVYREVFRDGEYELRGLTDVRTIVDLGANIGLSAIRFAEQFADAAIVTVEPESENFRVLTLNTEAYPNIRRVQAAVWSQDASVPLAGISGSTYRVGADLAVHPFKEQVAAVSLPSLLRDQGIGHVDILKMDVEGAEKAIFETASEWIDRVEIILVELHDRFVPGCTQAVYTAAQDFEMFQCSSNQLVHGLAHHSSSILRKS